jgi:hypothetical protein
MSICKHCGEEMDKGCLSFPNCCKSATLEYITELRGKMCDAYTTNGLPCKHMNDQMVALGKKHFDKQVQQLSDEFGESNVNAKHVCEYITAENNDLTRAHERIDELEERIRIIEKNMEISGGSPDDGVVRGRQVVLFDSAEEARCQIRQQ